MLRIESTVECASSSSSTAARKLMVRSRSFTNFARIAHRPDPATTTENHYITIYICIDVSLVCLSLRRRQPLRGFATSPCRRPRQPVVWRWACVRAYVRVCDAGKRRDAVITLRTARARAAARESGMQIPELRSHCVDVDAECGETVGWWWMVVKCLRRRSGMRTCTRVCARECGDANFMQVLSIT